MRTGDSRAGICETTATALSLAAGVAGSEVSRDADVSRDVRRELRTMYIFSGNARQEPFESIPMERVKSEMKEK